MTAVEDEGGRSAPPAPAAAVAAPAESPAGLSAWMTEAGARDGGSGGVVARLWRARDGSVSQASRSRVPAAAVDDAGAVAAAASPSPLPPPSFFFFSASAARRAARAASASTTFAPDSMIE